MNVQPSAEPDRSNGYKPANARAVSPEEAAGSIRSGQRVFVGSGAGEPREILRALDRLRPGPADIELLSIFPLTASLDGDAPRRHRGRILALGADGETEPIPISTDEAATLISHGRLPIDVAVIQASPPDAHGYASLGTSPDLATAALGAAKRVLIEVNAAMPRTQGSTLIRLDEADMLVAADTPLPEFPLPRPSEAALHIAAYVTSIIENGATLHLGPGSLPDRVMRLLGDRRALSIHTDLLTEGIENLIASGALAGKRSDPVRPRILASACLGTSPLYRLIHDNPLFHFAPIEQVCDPGALSRIRRLVSIVEVRAIDLTGAACLAPLDHWRIGAPSTQPLFLRAAARAPGGKAILCLRATDAEGASRIKPALGPGEPVGLPGADTHFVVSEYGVAYLHGRSLAERALALIGIAHPDHRAALLEEAKRDGRVGRGQSFASMQDYAVQAERRARTKNGTEILLRPARPTDAAALRRLFHQLTPNDVYTRFFQQMRNIPETTLQSLCNVDEESDVAFVATIGQREHETVIGSGCYFLLPKTRLVEVAYMVAPEYQGEGVGGALQQRMREHAIGRGVLGFVAEVLPRNARMMRLAKAAAGRTEVETDEEGAKITTWFAE